MTAQTSQHKRICAHAGGKIKYGRIEFTGNPHRFSDRLTISATEISAMSIASSGKITANGTVIFCMPGSTGACRTAWEGVLRDQLDSQHKPCNFVGVLRGH